MSIKELRSRTGLSQSKFAAMFDIPVSTLKDWEQERRTPPAYVVNMIKKILELQGILINDNCIDSYESRRRSVERVLAILFTATNGPDETFMKVLDSYISGEITLKEMETRVDRLEYLGANV